MPPIFGIDSMHGANYVRDAPMFPHMLHAAASFDPQHAYNAARSAARHTRAAGIDWVFAPVLDVAVHSRFPRVYESGGEDPRVAGVFGAAIVQGLQGMPLRTAALRRVPKAQQAESERAMPMRAAIPNDLSGADVVAACMKHFIGCVPTACCSVDCCVSWQCIGQTPATQPPASYASNCQLDGTAVSPIFRRYLCADMWSSLQVPSVSVRL